MREPFFLCWKLEVGGWRFRKQKGRFSLLEVGGWRLEVRKAESVLCVSGRTKLEYQSLPKNVNLFP